MPNTAEYNKIKYPLPCIMKIQAYKRYLNELVLQYQNRVTLNVKENGTVWTYFPYIVHTS